MGHITGSVFGAAIAGSGKLVCACITITSTNATAEINTNLTYFKEI